MDVVIIDSYICNTVILVSVMTLSGYRDFGSWAYVITYAPQNQAAVVGVLAGPAMSDGSVSERHVDFKTNLSHSSNVLLTFDRDMTFSSN